MTQSRCGSIGRPACHITLMIPHATDDMANGHHCDHLLHAWLIKLPTKCRGPF